MRRSTRRNPMAAQDGVRLNPHRPPAPHGGRGGVPRLRSLLGRWRVPLADVLAIEEATALGARFHVFCGESALTVDFSLPKRPSAALRALVGRFSDAGWRPVKYSTKHSPMWLKEYRH